MTNPFISPLYNGIRNGQAGESAVCCLFTMQLVVIGLKGKALTYSQNQTKSRFASETGKRVLMQAAYLALGILMSRGMVFENYAPFGAALVAAAPFGCMAAAVVGSVVGYLLPSAITESVRYLAAVLAAGAIRWTLNDLKRVRSHPLFAPFVALGPVVATGIAMGSVEGEAFASDTIVMSLTEGLLAAGAAYFIARTAEAFSTSKGISALNQQELASAALSGCILVLSLAEITLGSVSVGRILAVLAILLCASAGGVPGGSVAGIAAGVVFSLSSPGVSYLSGAYAFSGLMAGMFAQVGRMGSVVAFILSNAVVALSTGEPVTVINGLYEVAAASVIFMAIPKRVESRFASLFAAPLQVVAREGKRARSQDGGVRRAMVSRLRFASKALQDVSESVEEVSRRLSKLSAGDLDGIYEKVAGSTCRLCGMKEYCWGQNYEGTMAVFQDLTVKLRAKGRVTEEDFAPYFVRKCSKINEVSELVNRQYGMLNAREIAERRVSQVRHVVSGQFSGMSDMLYDLSEEIEHCGKVDEPMEERVEELMEKYAIRFQEISCRLDTNGRLEVELEAVREDKPKLQDKAFLQELEKACDRAMDQPCISTTPDRCRMKLSEKSAMRTAIGQAQHVCDNGELCGDHISIFPDGMGKLVVVISDGMGTGGRAAVDGAMAAGILSKLFQAGFSFDCALRIVNSALVVKSGDESLATLDITCVDLFTGAAEFLKAGAPLTLIRKRGRVIRIDAPSLPAGILTEIGFTREQAVLGEEDWILMVSDGAVANGDEWLEQELDSWRGQDEQELADRIVRIACQRRTDGHDDDVTAIALRIHGG